jgi:nucleotide-binding universal stress UspA family protein
MGTIVVGVDGSEESQRALHWAAEMAGRLGSSLRVVYAFDVRSTWRDYPLSDEMSSQQATALIERVRREGAQAREHAEQMLASMLADAGVAGVETQMVVLNDHDPAEALVEQAMDAEMLVVGSRGRGGFKGLVMGSVSQQCLHHATCPVVVLRRVDR